MKITTKTCQPVLWLLAFLAGLTAALVMVSAVSASGDGITYVHQGQTVRVNDTLDISGVASPYSQLAYWDGLDMYNSAPTYMITFSAQRQKNFYLDPKIFSTRLGAWYKYDKKTGSEPHGNNLAFVVVAVDSAGLLEDVPTPGITGNAVHISVFPAVTASSPTISPVQSQATSPPLPVSLPTLPRAPLEMNNYAIGISIVTVGLFFGILRLLR
ncbi:DUF3821 domain-containing protein [uncultured Methanoregula sp.]|uniref:DUF3821 domain-containing protein n=1 Tax=uncultured Methanoregula sp. TaxID=1005933 RepID=UPI002AAAA49A|nr:DUF3821 domain-containing protein [uncultured Methanoregula sp.]